MFGVQTNHIQPGSCQTLLWALSHLNSKPNGRLLSKRLKVISRTTCSCSSVLLCLGICWSTKLHLSNLEPFSAGFWDDISKQSNMVKTRCCPSRSSASQAKNIMKHGLSCIDGKTQPDNTDLHPLTQDQAGLPCGSPCHPLPRRP